MNDRVKITMLEDGIADVRMTRVDKMNALDATQWAALVEAVETLKAMPGLRVVVLSGEGRAFCAGLDLASMQGDRDPGARARVVRWRTARMALPIMRNMPLGAGANFPCQSSPRCMALLLVRAARLWRQPIFGSSTPKRALRLWK